MLFAVLLSIHIAVATLSVVLHALFLTKMLSNQHTRHAARRVFASSVLTVLSGLLLLTGGSDISTTCITMGVYAAASFAFLYTAKKRGFAVVPT